MSVQVIHKVVMLANTLYCRLRIIIGKVICRLLDYYM